MEKITDVYVIVVVIVVLVRDETDEDTITSISQIYFSKVLHTFNITHSDRSAISARSIVQSDTTS